MAYDYAPITATALRLITKFGADLTFRDKGTTGDPVTGLGAVAGSDRTVKGVKITDIAKAFPETRIQAGDRAFIIESATILMSDKWRNGSEFWTVEMVTPIEPNLSDIVAVKVLVRA